MLSRLREQFGTAGLVVAVVALVAALAGGAIAANSGGSGGSQDKASASAKVKKGPRGPRGPKGATGPQGPAGPAGPAGAKGDTGAAGSNGTNGQNGAAGQSVTVATEPPGANCTTGGAKLSSSDPTPDYVCNGEVGLQGDPGPEGPEGDPWTAGGTLPPGSTQTGVYAMNASVDTILDGEENEVTVGDVNGALAPISFSIPLAAQLDETHVVYVPSNTTSVDTGPNPDPTNCAGSVNNPTAASGYLCVYSATLTGAAMPLIGPPDLSGLGAARSGAVLAFFGIEGGAQARGSWAVTG